MTEHDVKLALQNYHKFKKSIQTTLNKIEMIEVQQTKTGGSIIRMPDGSTNNEQRKLGLIERKTKLENDIEVYTYYIRLAEDFMGALKEPFRSLVRNKYVDKIKTDKLVEVYHYSRNGIMKVIDRLIERYIALT